MTDTKVETDATAVTATEVQIVKAHARRDGRWWYVSLPELGTSGQARTSKEVPEVAREIAALWLEVDEDSLVIEATIEVPGSIQALWEEAKRQESEAQERASHAAALSRQAIRELRQERYTLDDAARAFHISRQRAQQLARSV